LGRAAIFYALGLASICAFSATAQQAQPKIWGIRSVRISCNEQCAADQFYSTLLPLSGDCRWCGRVPGTNLGRAETPYFLNDSQEVYLTKSSPKPNPEGLAEITFATDNIEFLRRYLKESGLQANQSARDGSLSLIDPDGHNIGFVQRAENNWNYSHKVRGMRLIHAGFVVRDRAAMEHFYKDILGFKPYWHGGMKDDQTDWLDMQVPDGTDWIEFMLNVPAGADKKLLGVMNHIALGVPDIHAAEAQLLNIGWKPGEKPQIGRDGKWQLNLYDPDDTRVELMEFTPTQKPCCSEYTGPHPKP
jgi:catechol 2,3-dioxygenase-like lactoylglutathione lyase family enzyme